jgi:ribose/xylose/arabinose/galactoside ABC-type transport system permease subunit
VTADPSLSASPAAAASSAGSLSFARRFWRFVQPFVVLLIVVGIFATYGIFEKPSAPFISKLRMTLIAKQTAIVGVGALGMTVIMISGGIDLSVGSILAVAAVALAALLREGFDPVIAASLVLVIGLAVGAINGILITGLRLVPFIVTLGTMMIYRGAAEQIAHQNKIAISDAPQWLATLVDPPRAGSLQLVSTAAWLVVLLGIGLAIVLRFTVFGRHVFAVGSNEATARLCGINVPRTKIIVYALGGLFMALAGLFSFSEENNQGNPDAGLGMELYIIAAVVIGGGSLSGGRGSVLGSIVGALTMTVLKSGCGYMGVGDSIEKIVIGSIIIIAVAIDQLTQGRKPR